MLLSALIFIISACSQKKTDEIVIKTVKTDTVQVYGNKSASAFPGRVRAASEVNLAFRIAGPITKIYVDAGSVVKKGQVLAEMDSRDYAVQLAATEAEYHRTKAEANRIIALYEKGSVTANDHDKAVFGIKQITAKHEAHKNALTDTKLRAPFDGYVQKRFFQNGETVSAGMPVISMISASLPEIEIHIPTADFIRRGQFDSFSYSTDIHPNKTFPLELIGVAQKANLNQLYTVRLRMRERTPQTPSPGMSVMVTIQYKPEETALKHIPISAVFENNGTANVWVYNNSTQNVEKRAVNVTEILRDGKAVVSEGLSVGEIVVTAGVHVLRQGEKVRLLPPAPPSNVGGMM